MCYEISSAIDGSASRTWHGGGEESDEERVDERDRGEFDNLEMEGRRMGEVVWITLTKF
jgi:hypothetical protein